MIQRLPIAFGFLTASVVAIAWMMEGAGSASPKNPAWQFVSGLRFILLSTVGVIAAGFVLLLVLEFVEHYAAKKRRLNEEKENRLKRIEERLKWIERDVDRKDDATERSTKLERRLERHLSILERRVDQLEVNKAPEAAAENALKEFGGQSA